MGASTHTCIADSHKRLAKQRGRIILRALKNVNQPDNVAVVHFSHRVTVHSGSFPRTVGGLGLLPVAFNKHFDKGKQGFPGHELMDVTVWHANPPRSRRLPWAIGS